MRIFVATRASTEQNLVLYLTKFSYDDLGYDLKNVNIDNSQHNLAKPHLINCSRNILDLH